jgi:hypothetical protein
MVKQLLAISYWLLARSRRPRPGRPGG